MKARGVVIFTLAVLALCTAGISHGATVDFYLRAQTFTIPAATFDNPEAIVMWGFALCDSTYTVCGPPSSPGPQLSATDSDTLNIHVRNALTGPFVEPVSLVIPGQIAPLHPVWIDDTGTPFAADFRPGGDVTSRVRSFTTETPPDNVTTTTYTWNNVRQGTFLYRSGTHQAIQLQMGLFGALLVNPQTAGLAYDNTTTNPDTAYVNQVVLVYSEIDPELHYSVSSGNYGIPQDPPPAPPVRGRRTSAVEFHPKFFLVNGAPYTASRPDIPAGLATQPLLLRFLYGGLDTKAPTFIDRYLSIIADDGNLLPYPKQQYSLLLAAGQTTDAILTPAASGRVPLFDRRLNLTNGGVSPGGMLVYLSVGAAPVAPAALSPSLQAPSSVDFGNVRRGRTRTRGVTVRNTGQGPLNITGLAIGGRDARMFQLLNGDPAVVAPGGSLRLYIKFRPSSRGSKSATLAITSNDPTNPVWDVALTGTGL